MLEDARGRAYSDVGHDFDSDPTLATDPLITGTAPNYLYTGVSPAEPLAGRSVDAGAAGGSDSQPAVPLQPAPVTSQQGRDRPTPPTVYVTHVTPATGTRTSGSWPGHVDAGQYATAARSVTMSTFLSDAVAPPDPQSPRAG